MNIEVNLFTLLAAVVASMLIGYLWYSPMLFGKPWMKLMGISKEDMKGAKKGMTKMYTLSAVAAFVTAYVLFHVSVMSQKSFGYSPLDAGLSSAFWVWLGFVAPVQFTDVLFGGKKFHLFAINTGYQLASLLVMGVVFGLL